MSSTEEPSLCVVCGAPGTVCLQCKDTFYCSVACQKADWPVHGLLCSEFARHGASRPSPAAVRTIVFPVDKINPQFGWMPTYNLRFPDSVIGPQGGNRGGIWLVQPNDGIALPGSLSVAPKASASIGHIQRVMAIQGQTSRVWRGTVTAIGCTKGKGFQNLTFRDMGLSDFRDMAALFVEKDHYVTAVRINCEGDMRTYKRPQYEYLNIPSFHSIFTEHHTSDIAERINCPLFTQCCPPDEEWACNLQDYQNDKADLLHVFLPPDRSDWSFVAREWPERVGSVLVVHQDRYCNIDETAVHAIADYCHEKVVPLLARPYGNCSDSPISREEILATITQEKFSAWLPTWLSTFQPKHARYTLPRALCYCLRN